MDPPRQQKVVRPERGSSMSGNRGLTLLLAGASTPQGESHEGEKDKGNGIFLGDGCRDWRGSRRHLFRRVCPFHGCERGCGGKEAGDGLLRRYTARLSRPLAAATTCVDRERRRERAGEREMRDCVCVCVCV